MWWWALGILVVLVLVLVFSSKKNQLIIKEVELASSLEVKNNDEFDVVFIGAGLSGISAAHGMITRCQKKSYVILETRQAVGGTWDLFRYPGIRSDSDMFTLGFSHRPWINNNPIAPGKEIRDYIRIVAKESGVDKHISYGKTLVAADFCKDTQKWTLEVKDNSNGEIMKVVCHLLHMCSGYYDYENPHRPQFEGEETFKGEIIHPQHWKEDLDYNNKKIVIIGSGATAVTLLPSLADDASHVTMLQRSPSYILALPQDSTYVRILQRYFPERFAYLMIRWRNILLSWTLFTVCKKFPNFSKRLLVKQMLKRVPSGNEKNFSPTYNPWDQRVCLSPDADIFKAIREGKASVVTDIIEKFVPNGILLKSGDTLEADIIITATGLTVKLFGGAKLSVDGKEIKMNEHFLYRGMMIDNIPNLFYYSGYTNASWTLKCEITAEWATRYMNHMDKTGAKQCYPYLPPNHTLKPKPVFDFTSGYILRAADQFPKLGDTGAWSIYDFFPDLFYFAKDSVLDGVMKFE